MATYLVTGCVGFIGAKVSEFLLADGGGVLPEWYLLQPTWAREIETE